MGNLLRKVAKNPVSALALGPGMALTALGLKNMFGGGNEGNASPSSYEEALARMAMDQYNSTAPLRQGFLQQYTDLMTGHLDPSQLPQYAPAFSQGKQAIEDQYALAKDNVLSNAPRGGAMQGGLYDVEMNRAEQASSLPMMLSAGITEDMMNKAFGTSFQTAPQLAMSGMGTVAGTMSNRLMQEQANRAQQQAGLMGALGQIGGMGLGFALGGPLGAGIGGALGGGMAGGGGGGRLPGYQTPGVRPF